MPIKIECEHDVNCYEAGKGLIKKPEPRDSKDWACCGKRGCVDVPGPVDARVACKASTRVA
jgi:hypothetical protein